MQKTYKCPCCQNPLTSMTRYNRDFFCKSCFTAVNAINSTDCIMLPPGEKYTQPCKLELITV